MMSVRSIFSPKYLALVLVLGAAACGGSENDCDRAVDHAKSCGLKETMTGSCSGSLECVDECVLAASCDELTDAAEGNTNAFTDCSNAC